MCKFNKKNSAEKIVKKALKNLNKELRTNKYTKGRYVIRDCFHQIEETKEKGLLLTYCFECIDKYSMTKKFYQFSTSSIVGELTVDKFQKKLKEIISSFSTHCLVAPDNMNYKHIKID